MKAVNYGSHRRATGAKIVSRRVPLLPLEDRLIAYRARSDEVPMM